MKTSTGILPCLRCQYLLHSGKFVDDILFYNGYIAPNLLEQKHTDPIT